MTSIIAWHATSASFDRFKPFSHFGSRAQAEMRRTRGGRLLRCALHVTSLKSLKDTGSWDEKKLRQLQRYSYEGVVYLNRFEGIPLEAFDRARAAHRDIDALSDARFRAALPEAEMSYIIFDPSRITILETVPAHLLD